MIVTFPPWVCMIPYTRKKVLFLALAACATLAGACGPSPGLTILEPERGAVLAGPDVTVRWRVDPGAAADTTASRAGDHAHVLLDRDLPAVGEPIPTGDPAIVHVRGQASHTFRGVGSGPHRVTVVLGDAAHRARGGFYRASTPFRVAGP